jgi:hypothetical protein
MCLAKIQQLHNIVFGIFERVESEITTIYHIDESAKTKAIKSDNIYAGFPIMVEVAGQEDELRVEQSVSAINFGTVLKQKILSRNIKPLFRIGVAAAAVILIATALFLNIPTARAVTLEGIYKAISRVKNVYISSFIPDKKEPVQEQWVSRTLNVNLIKTGNGSVLWDITNKVKKVKRLDSSSVETTILSAEMIAEIHNVMTGSLGLMPFYDISDVPKDTEWRRVDDSIELANGIEVYNLIWIEKTYSGSLISSKWKFFIDSETNLPQKIELYQKTSTDSEYNLKRIVIVECLDNNEIKKVIKEASF